MFSTETRTRTFQLVAAIVEAVSTQASPFPSIDSTETDSQTLALVEHLARRLNLLPSLPSSMPTITKSIGTTGRDYSTITAWEADLDNGAVYASGDVALGECYNDSAFDENVTINGGGTVGLAGVTLSAASGERHDGTAGTGARLVASTDTKSISMTPPASLTTKIEWLEHDYNGHGLGGNGCFNKTDNAAADGYIQNCIAHGVLMNTSSGTYGIRVGTRRGYVQNCIVYDIVNTHSVAGTCYGIGMNSAFGANFDEVANCTVHDIVNDNGSGACHAVFLPDVAGRKLRNTIATGTGGTSSGTITCFSVTAYGTATSLNNAASDTSASGTGSIDSVVAADQYVSTTGGSEDLHLKTGADCIDAGTDLGTTPTGVNLDIDGRDRDAEGDTWDIGADEFVASGGGSVSVPIAMHHYKQMMGVN